MRTFFFLLLQCAIVVSSYSAATVAGMQTLKSSGHKGYNNLNEGFLATMIGAGLFFSFGGSIASMNILFGEDNTGSPPEREERETISSACIAYIVNIPLGVLFAVIGQLISAKSGVTSQVGLREIAIASAVGQAEGITTIITEIAYLSLKMQESNRNNQRVRDEAVGRQITVTNNRNLFFAYLESTIAQRQTASSRQSENFSAGPVETL